MLLYQRVHWNWEIPSKEHHLDFGLPWCVTWKSIVMIGLHSCSREALLTLLWKVTTFGLYGFWRVSEGWYAILEILPTSFYIYVGMVWVFKHVQLSLAFGSQKCGCQISDSRDCLRDRKRCPPPISTPQVLWVLYGRNEQIQCHIIPLGSPGFLACSLVKSCGAPMKTIPVTPRVSPRPWEGDAASPSLCTTTTEDHPLRFRGGLGETSGDRRLDDLMGNLSNNRLQSGGIVYCIL